MSVADGDSVQRWIEGPQRVFFSARPDQFNAAFNRPNREHINRAGKPMHWAKKKKLLSQLKRNLRYLAIISACRRRNFRACIRQRIERKDPWTSASRSMGRCFDVLGRQAGIAGKKVRSHRLAPPPNKTLRSEH